MYQWCTTIGPWSQQSVQGSQIGGTGDSLENLCSVLGIKMNRACLMDKQYLKKNVHVRCLKVEEILKADIYIPAASLSFVLGGHFQKSIFHQKSCLLSKGAYFCKGAYFYN